MAGVWKRDGTIAVTKGSKKVVGTGTTFTDPKNAAAKGHLLVMVTGTAVDLYEVDYSESNSVFYLVEAYRGDTGTGKAYAIDTSRTDSIPEFARRLNATLGAYQQQSDAFQALMTSDAATIEVTAPDGTKHTMIPWKRVTSEGEGQAARAKVEADRSRDEANRSKDEADRTAGMVAAAALPLPDVWAPLSDSLRLITGYGREVLVGSDVVARMVNFSRNSTATYIGKDGQLKTAAANEPRFEKDGLLIEGQSSNIVTNSNVFTPFGAGATKVDNQTGPFGANDATRIDTVNAYTGTNPPLSSPLVDGAVYTTSVWLRGAVGGEVVRIGIHNATIGLGVTLTTEWKRYSITQTRTAGTNSAFVIQAASAPISFFVYGVQLEALPFASSYIPTAGAAVTRAKDILYLAPSGNVPSDINIAFAAQIKLMGKGLNSCPRVFEISDPANKGSFVDMTTGMWGGVNLVGVRKTVAARFSDTSRWLDGVNLGSAWQPYPVKTYSDPVYIAGSNVTGSRDFYGHVRNVRAWFFSPTDDQMKAIR